MMCLLHRVGREGHDFMLENTYHTTNSLPWQPTLIHKQHARNSKTYRDGKKCAVKLEHNSKSQEESLDQLQFS